MDEDGPVLPVASGGLEDDSFEMDLPPANGLDYLRRVRYAQS